MQLNFNDSDIPQHIQESLDRYVNQHTRPGSFLSAVLQNDLASAITKADGDNLPRIKSYVLWCINNIPHLYGEINFRKHLNRN